MNDALDQQNERLFNAIEDALVHMHKKSPPRELMADIRRRYPSPVFFVESNAYTLRHAGLPRLDAFYFTMIPALARKVGRESYGKKPRLDKLSKMAGYLATLFIGIHVECFYEVLLDSRGYVIDTVLVRKGTTNSTPFYLKEALSIAVQKEARAVVLCHNHPCGTLKPSREDVACTLKAMNAFAALEVPVLDHVIIAQDQAVSMRDCGAVPASLWAMQAPDSKLLRDWIDVDLLADIDFEQEDTEP